jgi:molybdopterin converting factor small subunit
MKIRLHYPAMMQIAAAKSGNEVEVQDNASIEEMLQGLVLKKEHVRYILVFVNGERKGMSHRLRHNDEVKLYLPVGGG